ncbi:MAG: hypothetical protein BGO96_05345 [Micrococcales bacterium 73-15]|uniref:MobF family relaxase n=1 Tax=Salana multivorans TaxID=120377 RepID=UPI000967196F|nr:MobF family relaxase [Salana multivorans]OJX97357.1 MAG: hypothetical protein BGO96_05345 [Micrococcales bacterium 73-15]
MITTSRTGLAFGHAYRYLTKTVAAGDGDLKSADALLRYYEANGTPPGRWLGSGLALLGDDARGILAGDQVTEEQMNHLFGHGRDPLTLEVLGRRPTILDPLAQRIEARVQQLPGDLSGSGRDAAIARLTAEETARRPPQSRAGFDLTFTLPKSVSTLWAVSDAGVQAQIAAAHHEAIAECLAILERQVIMTRVGAAGIAQIETRGLIAAAFDHYDSRGGDPHLHTHVVIANRIQGVDGGWRTIDSRAMYPAIVAMSRTHDALLADRLAQRLPVAWEQRTAGPRATPKQEIAGVPEDLIRAFSSRREEILRAREDNREVSRDALGRELSERESRDLDADSWRDTRPDKHLRALAELTASWRERAVEVLVRLRLIRPQDSDVPEAAAAWASDLLRRSVHAARPSPIRADDLTEDVVAAYASGALAAVQAKRSTWTRWNLHSEAAGALGQVRFASAGDLEAALDRVVDHAVGQCEVIATPSLAHTPGVFLRSDGSSAFDVRSGTVFTSEAILAAEDYLLTRAATLTAPTVTAVVCAEALAAHDPAVPLGEDQADAVTRITSSARALDVLVGPAGTGKTTTLAALRAVWEAEHGAGSVVGVAPSAAAAAVLGSELGIETENTAKWITENRLLPERHQRLADLRARIHTAQRAGRPVQHLLERARSEQAAIEKWTLRRGQLLLVDEASLAGTFALQRMVAAAEDAGAKVVMVGDPYQLAAVDAGGAFGMVCRTLADDAPTLRTVHRFRQEWEAEASLLLRTGQVDVLTTYATHDRIREGSSEEMIDGAYATWLQDTQSGITSLLIASDNETVRELNLRAQEDLIHAGMVTPGAIELIDETTVGAGDLIVTRQNDRRLTTSAASWVKNGDRWRVINAREDGALIVQREHGGPTIALPGYYVAEHVELAYASTAHRAQGSTVETAHAVITGEATTREALYVCATRGRASNTFWVATSDPEHDHAVPAEALPTGMEVLERALGSIGAESSAHHTREDMADAARAIPRLAHEYETIAVAATQARWVDLLETSGLSAEQISEILDSPTWGALSAALRRADASHVDIDTTLPRLIQARELDSTADLGAVLHYRLEAWLAQPGHSFTSGGLIAGLIPRARTSDPDLQRALSEREAMILARAETLLDRAVTTGQPWATPPPERTAAALDHWRENMLTVVAYRDRWGVTTAHALGNRPTPTAPASRNTNAPTTPTSTSANRSQPRKRRAHPTHPRRSPSIMSRPSRPRRRRSPPRRPLPGESPSRQSTRPPSRPRTSSRPKRGSGGRTKPTLPRAGPLTTSAHAA